MSDYSKQRAEREFNRNPPTNAPGQGFEGASGWDSMEIDPDFSGSNMEASLSGNVDSMSLNEILGVDSNTTSDIPIQGMQGQMSPQGEDIEDKILRGIISCLKGIYIFSTTFFSALLNNNARDWHKLGVVMVRLSLLESAIGLVLSLMGVFIRSIDRPATLILAGSASFGVGFCIVAASKSKMNKGYSSESEVSEPNFSEPEDFNNTDQEDFSEDSFSGIDWGDEDDSSIGSTDEEEVEDSVWNWEDDEDGSEWTGEEDSLDINSFDPVAEAQKIDVPAGQYTRSYLLETFLKVLPTINPNFHKLEPIYEDSDDFMMFDEYLRNSAIQSGISADKLDELYLESVEINPFVIRLTATRPSGIKEQEIADGVADCYKRDEHGAVIEDREGCYASVDAQVGRFSINIFRCANVMVSLGDVIKQKYEFVSDPKVIMPLFWGVNEMGKVYCYDGIKAGNGSMLISGEGRSGKSWKGQSLIAQMSMFMSPKDINFYFFDNKGKLSDYYYLSTRLPHVKGFCGNPLKYVSELQKILEWEKPIREKAIHSAGVNNINDYNKLNPNNKLPYIYIVVDEMAAAMKEMDAYDKEMHKQFNSLMLSIVTNLPYFGIRLLLFPHRLVDFIIDKTTAQQISCRAVVGVLDFETLKSALDIRNKKDFPYNLVKPGDMAIRTKDIRNGVATYTKSEVLSDSETTNRKIFDYIGEVWAKLEPDCKTCIKYDDGKVSSKTARDISSDLGDYSVRNAFSQDELVSIFSEDEDDSASLDDLIGDSDGEKDFWDSFKKG